MTNDHWEIKKEILKIPGDKKKNKNKKKKTHAHNNPKSMRWSKSSSKRQVIQA